MKIFTCIHVSNILEKCFTKKITLEIFSIEMYIHTKSDLFPCIFFYLQCKNSLTVDFKTDLRTTVKHNIFLILDLYRLFGRLLFTIKLRLNHPTYKTKCTDIQ